MWAAGCSIDQIRQSFQYKWRVRPRPHSNGKPGQTWSKSMVWTLARRGVALLTEFGPSRSPDGAETAR
jgi:hypothetical protein